MDGPVYATTAAQGRVGRIHDSVDSLLGDIAFNDFEFGRANLKTVHNSRFCSRRGLSRCRLSARAVPVGAEAGFVKTLTLLLLILLVCGCQPTEPASEQRPTVTPRPISRPGANSPTPTPVSKSLQQEPEPEVQLSARQTKLLQGARSTIGDVYDDAYYGGGPPPQGRGACTDVIYSAYMVAGTDLQDAIESDIAARPSGYPNLGDRNINYRRAPNLIVWFERHTKTLPLDTDFQPGDVVFWSLLDDGVADHVGLVSDRPEHIIHNIGPRCREDDSLRAWTILGHFR